MTALAALPNSYTNVDTLREALPVFSMTSVTSAQISRAIGRVEAVMNSRMVRRYALPFTQVVPILQTIATDLSIYESLGKQVFAGNEKNTSQWPDRFKESTKLLDAIADGKMNLVAVDGSVIEMRTDRSQVWSDTMDYNPTFGDFPSTLSFTDPDKVDAELSARDIATINSWLT